MKHCYTWVKGGRTMLNNVTCGTMEGLLCKIMLHVVQRRACYIK